MKTILYLSFLIFFGLNFSRAQNSLKDNLFNTYEMLLDKLQNKNAEILAPEHFKEAVDYYKEASTDYDNQKNSLLDIKNKLEESRRIARQAFEIIRAAHDTLSQPIASREAALNENAPLFAPDQWDAAENVFKDAISNLEDNDIEDAVDYGVKAQKLFKKAEILAIKNNLLGDARSQVSVAKHMDAPKYCKYTFLLAENFLNDAENILANNPYAKEEARKRAEQAAYEGRHAQYLSQKIKKISQDYGLLEDELLNYESLLSDMAAVFQYQPKFDKGVEKPAREILDDISDLKAEEKNLIKKNARLEEELNSLKESDASKSAKLQQNEQLMKKIQIVKGLFKASEAQVIFQGNKLLIHLFGLYFPSGKAIIQPEYYSLLSKLQKAIKEFPDKYILIEGHTDATGNSYKNKKLSQKRAQAVAEYLLANIDLNPNQIEFFGLGDQKPIASNKTKEGRAKNRRIDVIISITD